VLDKSATLRIVTLNVPDEAADVAGRFDGGEVGGEGVSAVRRRPVVFCGKRRGRMRS
jgi:hypothetical protein